MEKCILEHFKKIYDWLEDEQSKEIYINRLNFLITGNYKYIHNIINKYVPDMAALNDIAIPQLLKQLPADKEIILYGAGEDARANLIYFTCDKRFRCLCDIDINKQKNGVDGYKVISPDELLENKDCSIVISTHRGYDSIRAFLISRGVCESRIYKMTPYMFAIQDQQYFNPDFMKFEDEEVFIDAGSCDLTTAIKLKMNCPKVKRVYSFEPDKNNLIICKKNAEQFESGVVKLFNDATWSSRCSLSFDASSDGSSHVSVDGHGTISAVPIDEVILSEDKVTFIKMDVEGSELESLIGAKKTIMRDKPKLAICIYHKPADMYLIPEYIKELNPAYKIYIRHHSNGQGETVLYAMP